MSVKFKVELLGLDQIQERLTAIRSSSETEQLQARILFHDASTIISIAARLCPVLTGNLRATLHTKIPVIEAADRVTCQFGCGGPAAPYATYVHEDLTKRHKNGTAKFVEIPFLQYVAGNLSAYATELRAAQIFGRSSRAIGRGL